MFEAVVYKKHNELCIVMHRWPKCGTVPFIDEGQLFNNKIFFHEGFAVGQENTLEITERSLFLPGNIDSELQGPLIYTTSLSNAADWLKRYKQMYKQLNNQPAKIIDMLLPLYEFEMETVG